MVLRDLFPSGACLDRPLTPVRAVQENLFFTQLGIVAPRAGFGGNVKLKKTAEGALQRGN